MDNNSFFHQDADPVSVSRSRRARFKTWSLAFASLAVAAGIVIVGPAVLAPGSKHAAAPPPPLVTVSVPLQRNVDTNLEFLGQFSPMQKVDIRPQVGGTLTQIGFKDGDIVHKGDLLFQIDPTPYQIKLSEAAAQLEAAKARLELANRQVRRFSTLSHSGAGTVEETDQAIEEQRAAQAAVDGAQAQINDAQFDLDHTRITAPFTGRISNHLVSVGDLISGSRAGSGPTTLLTTLVSTGPIYLNFDMSESDYMAFLRDRQTRTGPLAEKVQVALEDETTFEHEGTLNFIDNSLNSSSGTIHARATLPNNDSLITPGGFARVRVEIAPPAPTLLVPDAAVLPDQSQHIVLTVGPHDKVVPKVVQIGDLRFGLRVIQSGLKPTDQVIVGGIPGARPGIKVDPKKGSIQLGSDLTDGGDEQ